MKKSIRKIIEYDFDKAMSKGITKLLYLLTLTIIIVAVILGGITYLFKINSDVCELMWSSFTHMLDPGVISGASYDDYAFTIPMLIATIFGVLFTATLIGIINSMIFEKFELLRRTVSKVLDEQHTIILGYDETTFNIICQLLMSYENSKKKHIIVVVGEKEKCEMEEEIKNHIKSDYISVVNETNSRKRRLEKKKRYKTWKNTTILCRTGVFGERFILDKCNIKRSKVVIINSYNDFATMKALLTINTIAKDNKDIYPKPFVVAIVMRKENLELFKYKSEAEWNRVILYYSNQISRIAAHSCIHPGVSNAFEEIFDFGGDEIYIEKPKNYDSLFGREQSISFGRILNKINNGVIIGYKKDGKCNLNPAYDEQITRDDDLLIIQACEHCSSIDINKTYEKTRVKFKKGIDNLTSDNVIIFGANENLPEIVAELNKYMNMDSNVIIACTISQLHNCLLNLNVEKYSKELEKIKHQLLEIKEEFYVDNRIQEIFKYLIESYIAIQNAETIANVNREEVVRYANIKLEVCDIYAPDSLEMLMKDIQFDIIEENYEHALILADNTIDSNDADEKTLFLLMNLKCKYKEITEKLNITVDIKKAINQKIVSRVSVDDYIICSKIVSNMITQISQNKDLTDIFEELLDISGNEIYIEPFSKFFDFENEMYINFHQLTEELTRNRRRLPIGYRVKNDKGIKIIMNPDKNKIYKFTKGDSIILIAHDDEDIYGEE